MSDSWQEKSTIIVRSLVNDLTLPYTYEDHRIQQLFVTCAHLIKKEIEFNTTYTIDVVGVSISPTPTDDDAFINLVSLKTACMVMAGEVKTYATNGIKIVDAGATIDMTSAFDNVKTLYDQLCEDYEKAKLAYVLGNVNTIKAILTPYTQDYNNPSIMFG